MIVGIDLGTTHTVAAFGDEASDEIALLPIPQLVARSTVEPRELLPSVLYAPLASEGLVDPFAPPPFIEGELARVRAAEIPGRGVVSAKSWLPHAGVDRNAPILPWGSNEEDGDVPRISPVDASARYLARVKAALNEAKLPVDDVVLTVPASFDESARELTLEAAARVGLRARLLEEPQAAFYDVMRRIGDRGLAELLDRTNGEARILVCDVGGGTTDLSLLKVSRTPDLKIDRVAVGRHLLLGGDNMDLALAVLAETRFGKKLDASRFAQLVVACRNAKEQLLSQNAPAAAPVRILTAGAKLVGGTLATEFTRADAEQLLIDGFFPIMSREAFAAARALRTSSAMISFGLPFERDPAITRHVAAFIARHASENPPNVLLLNGGVFHAPIFASRVAEQIAVFAGAAPVVLANDAPDVAVARGAVAYGRALARREHHEKSAVKIIGGGSPRSYFIGTGDHRAICVLPRGAEEGAACTTEGRVFALIVGKPARFDLFASDEGHDRAGDVVELGAARFLELPNVTARLGEAGRTREIRVVVRAELTAVGTLDLSCVENGVDHPRRFRLSFALREPDATVASRSTRPPPSASTAAHAGANQLIASAFDTSAERLVKDLQRDLERRLGERATWSIELARSLFDAFATVSPSRKRSADHERVFWLIAGFCIRPGFGAAGDEDRAHHLSRLFAEKVTFVDNPRVWQQFFIAYRRAAGGLDERTQLEMRDAFDPLLAPAEANLKKSKKWKPLSLDDLLETAASLERVPAPRRAELGNWLIERTWTDRDPRIWSAIGKLGARAPAYASVHHVIAHQTAEKWLDHLLREKWEALQTAEFAAVRLARVTGDRARDVSDRVRAEVEKRLVKIGARPESIRAVRELVPMGDVERAALFGEALPIGLRLV